MTNRELSQRARELAGFMLWTEGEVDEVGYHLCALATAVETAEREISNRDEFIQWANQNIRPYLLERKTTVEWDERLKSAWRKEVGGE